jgi:hypothetical protein
MDSPIGVVHDTMNKRIPLQLSTVDLHNVTSAIYEMAFQFIASGQSYYCIPSIADLLSLPINYARKSDSLIDVCAVSIPDLLNQFEYVQLHE